MDDGAVGTVDGAAFFLFFYEGLREAIARAELHGAENGLGCGSAEIVVLQIAVAVFVDEIAAFGAGGVSDEEAGGGQAGGVILDEFHVLQRSAGTIGEAHAVAGLDAGVGGEGKNAAAAAGAENDGLGGDGLNFAGHEFDGDHALDAAIVDEEFGDEPFVVAKDGVVFHGGLKKSVQHVEAGFVGGEPGAHLFHSTEGADGDVAVVLAAPGAAPVLELEKFLGGFFYEGFDGVLIAEPVAAGDGVVGVLVERVVGFDDAGGAAFGGDGVTPHGIDLGDDGDFQVGIEFGYSYGGAEASTTTSDQENVVGRNVHKDNPELSGRLAKGTGRG